MSRTIHLAVAAALAAGAVLTAHAEDRVYRIGEGYHPVVRAPEWNLAANGGMCRLRIWVDDRARVKLRGDEITVETDSGKRAFDQGSVCTQPLPGHAVDNFHVVVEQGRGTVMEVREPNRTNDYTGTVSVVDPQNGGESYDLVMAWNNPGAVVGSAPEILPGPAPVVGETSYFDEARACQDRVRAKFLGRNQDGDAYIQFDSTPVSDHLNTGRSHIRGSAWAHNRYDSRPITYRCTVDEQEQRVVSASYDVRKPPQLSSIE